MNYCYKNIKNTTSDFQSTNSNFESGSQSKFSGFIKTITLVMMLLVFGFSNAATRFSVATGNWNATSTWSATSGGASGASVPVAGDVVTVEGGFNVTLTANAACSSIAFTTTTATSLTLGAFQLDVSGVITIPRSGSGTNIIVVGAGTLNAGSIAFTSGGGGVRHQITISTGTVTVTGDVTTDNTGVSASITFTGAGTLNSGVGIMTTTTSGGTLTTFAGSTVNYNGLIAQTVKAVPYLGNLTLSGSGAKTVTGSTINGVLSMEGTATTTGTVPTYGAASTLQYKGTGAQTTGVEFPATWSGTGGVIIANTSGNAVTFGAAKTISGNLNINTNAKVNLGTFSSTAATLTLGGTVKTAGGATYGGTNTSGTTVDTTYFASATGVLTVGIGCTTGTWVGTTSTDWNTTTNWCNGTIPTATTDVTIPSGGNQPTISGAAACKNITISSGATLTVAATGTLSVSGAITKTGTLTLSTGSTVNYAGGTQTVLDVAYSNLIISGTGTKTWTFASTRIIGGNFTIATGATLTIASGRGPTVTGTTSVSGTLSLNISTSRTATFNGNIIINSGGTWTGVTASPITIAGNLQNNGTFSAGSSSFTFNGTANQSIAGFTTTGSISMTKTAGVATFTGNVSGAGLTINGTGGTLNLGVGLTHTFSGTWTRTNGTLDGGSSTVNFSNTTAVSGTGGTFTPSTSTVNYSGGTQTIALVTYNNLTLSGAGGKTFPTGATNVNGVLSIENGTNTNTFTGTLVYGSLATLQYNAATSARTVSTEWPATFLGSGGVIIKGTGIITLNAAKVLGTNTNVPLNIISGAKLATGNFGLTFHGNFINAGTFTAGSSEIVITGTTTTQSIAGFTTTGAVSMTKASGTATLTGAVTGAGLTIGTGSSTGTLNLGTSLTHTFSGNVTLTAGTLNGGTLTTINANSTNANAWNGTGTVFVPGTSTVVFGGGRPNDWSIKPFIL
jgi:hypothetical protein